MKSKSLLAIVTIISGILSLFVTWLSTEALKKNWRRWSFHNKIISIYMSKKTVQHVSLTWNLEFFLNSSWPQDHEADTLTKVEICTLSYCLVIKEIEKWSAIKRCRYITLIVTNFKRNFMKFGLKSKNTSWPQGLDSLRQWSSSLQTRVLRTQAPSNDDWENWCESHVVFQQWIKLNIIRDR